jgi:hypothetical protein
MSKFLDKLERIWAGKAQPIGFGPQTAKSKTPAMAIVARLSPGEADMAALAGEGGADALLVSIDNLERVAKTLSRFTKAAGDTPWGVSVKAVTRDNVEQLIKLGCDFLIFNADEVPVAILGEERIGKVVEVDPSLSDGLARTIARLPIDAVFLSAEQQPLTLRQLMDCARLASLVGKPALAALPSVLHKEDIEGLWQAGIRGLVLTMEGQSLSQVKGIIQALPPTRKKAEKGMGVILPAVELPSEEEEEEEEI